MPIVSDGRLSIWARRCVRLTAISAAYAGWYRHRPSPGVRILMYHRVNDQRADDDLTVSPRAFEAQMAALASSGYRVVALETARRWLAGEATLEAPAAVITFDDGYADTYTQALPVLKRHRFPATVFVASGLIDTDRRMSRYAGGGPEDRMMTWAEVRALAESGLIEIGAHTVNHHELPRLERDKAREEIVASKRMLEARLERAIASFAYPRGAVNDAVRRLVAEAGFDAACAVRGGLNRRGADPLMLRRTGISGHDTVEDFLMKVSGAFDWLHRLVGV